MLEYGHAIQVVHTKQIHSNRVQIINRSKEVFTILYIMRHTVVISPVKHCIPKYFCLSAYSEY